MKFLKIQFYLIAFIFFFSLITYGQNNDLDSQKILWRLRADTITTNLLGETIKISALERALLFAKLGDLWWKTDKNQADNYFEKSVDAIFFYSSESIMKEKKEYFGTTRSILFTISYRNQKQAKRLVKILSNEDKNFEDEKNLNADALIKHALQIVKDNPNQAFQIGIIALRTGVPKEFYKLIWELRRNNRMLADQLFREAFTITKKSPSYDMLQGIQFAVLPESNTTNFPAELSASSQQKIEVLNFFADYITQLSAKKTVKLIESCSSEAILLSRSMKFFETLLPQKAGVVRQAIDSCVDAKNQSVFETLTNPSEKLDIEELLSLADKSKDNPLIRAAYLTKAALLAYNQKKYELVLKIVKGLSKEDLENDPNFWEELRYGSAGKLAYLKYEEGDSQSSLKTLQDVPADYQPFAKMVFISQFSTEDISTYDFRVGLLDDIRQGFVKSERPFDEKSNQWFLLIKSYSNHKLQNRAAEVFKEIVQGFNKFLSENKDRKLQMNSGEIISAFSPNLIEVQENSIFETIGLINQPKSRLNVSLAFLNITLQKYESLNSTTTKSDN